MLTLLRPFMGYVSLGLLITAALFFGLYRMEARHADKLRERNVALQSELTRISTEKDEQRETSEGNVRKVEDDSKVRTIVKIIREAPNPEQCGTPGLETLRDAL